MSKGTEKRVLTLGILTFCLRAFTFEVFFEFFSLSFHAFAKIKILFVTDALPIRSLFIRVFFISDELETVRPLKTASY